MPFSTVRKIETPPSAPGPQWSDEDLVRCCLEGDALAWQAIVEKYRNLVYSVPRRYRMPSEDAADIFQAVWLDLYQELPRLRNHGALRGWLVKVALNKCYRWKQRRTSDPLPDAERLAVAPEVADFENEQVVRECLRQLPERSQEMLRMLFFEDPPVPYAEVARRLGLAEGSIGFLRGRCLEKLREALARQGYAGTR